MKMKFIHSSEGGNHVRVRMFTGYENEHYALNGTLSFRHDEWIAFRTSMNCGHEWYRDSSHDTLQVFWEAEGSRENPDHFSGSPHWLVMYERAPLSEAPLFPELGHRAEVYVIKGPWGHIALTTEVMANDGVSGGCLPKVQIIGCDDHHLAEAHCVPFVQNIGQWRRTLLTQREG